MKNWFAANRRLFGLLAVLLPLAGLLVLVALRAGPLAAVPVTVATVESQALAPALFGIGTVEARYTHRIGPTFAGRVATVAVQPGDAVRAGQVVGEMDPIDLDERLLAQEAGLRRAEANVLAAQAQVREVGARRSFADAQAIRYARLLQSNSVSSEAAAGKRQEADAAAAAHQAATAGTEAASTAPTAMMRQDPAWMPATRVPSASSSSSPISVALSFTTPRTDGRNSSSMASRKAAQCAACVHTRRVRMPRLAAAFQPAATHSTPKTGVSTCQYSRFGVSPPDTATPT